MITGLTRARRRGLAVLASQDADCQCAVRSNTTSALGGLVYWQTADWLVAEGYAERRRDELTGELRQLTLTARGRKLAREEGLL